MKTLKKVLFLCAFNKNRSVAGAEVWKELIEERGYSVGFLNDLENFDFYVGSAGIDPGHWEGDHWVVEKNRQYDSDLGKLVDAVFSVHKYVTLYIPKDERENFIELDIPDAYDINNPNERFALRNLLREQLEKYLPEAKK